MYFIISKNDNITEDGFLSIFLYSMPPKTQMYNIWKCIIALYTIVVLTNFLSFKTFSINNNQCC